MKIQIAGSYELTADLTPGATVEAEYGENVIEGECFTLAHHARHYRHNPAPCLFENQPSFDGDILISHIDLDTVGGCLALYGRKPEDDAFWRGAAFIDTRGPHRIIDLPKKVQEMLYAYKAYDNAQKREKPEGLKGLVDVTDTILQHGEAVRKIISGDPGMIDAGKAWAREAEARAERVESFLVMENDYLRAFKTGNVFCNAAYYSPKLKKYIPAIVTWSREWSNILISFEDGGEKNDASVVAAKLWGSLAGGHAGIAGSPRGLKLPEELMQREFDRAIEEVLSLFG